MFYTWVQQAAAEVEEPENEPTHLKVQIDQKHKKRKGPNEKDRQLIDRAVVFLFLWSEMWKSFDNEPSGARDAHGLHNWRTYCKRGSSAETRDNLSLDNLDFLWPEESISWLE